ncbi:MAG: DUF4388 domain-containing protein [Myxococcales bacterium]|nr:DUF4388 domain-containing protein [Myxococcales bacterium]
MTASSPIVLVAAPEPAQSKVLAEMLRALRPGLRTVDLESSAEATPTMAMVLELPGSNLGKLSAQVRDRHPNLAIAVISPTFDDETIEAAAKVGAAAIIPSPCESSALTQVLRAHERKVTFAGRVSGIETGELLRLHAISGSDGVLVLEGAAGSGAIHLEGGQPVHARVADLRGAEAVVALLTWTDARATWIAGRSGCARTIVGRIQGLLERGEGAGEPSVDRAAVEALGDVVEKLERLSQTPDILAAYLLRNAEVLTGHVDAELDSALVGRALSRLALVFHDMEEQQGDGAGSEIQATVGEYRLVVDRLGPSRLGYQIGVVVRQATPVCKSLRRLIRQIDRSFRRSLAQGGQAHGGSSGSGSLQATGLPRVA